MDNELLSALEYLCPSDFNYTNWYRVGMALKDAGCSFEDWERWSRDDIRWHQGECEKKWASFKGEGITRKTLFYLARQNGWNSEADSSSASRAMNWDDTFEYEDQPEMDFDQYAWDQCKDLEDYLNALFKPSEFVSYVTESWQDDDGKWKPGKGNCKQTAGDLIRSLHRYPDDIGATVGDWHTDAGAWIRINPMDGKGISDSNVRSYRHVLVESDTLPLDEQEKLFRDLQLPIAAMVYSGGKSIHAVVKVDARNKDEYQDRVSYLFDYLREKGVDIDRQNRNASRMSRMPGVTRGEKRQKLLAVNIGKSSWDEWKDWIEGEDLPALVNFADYLRHPMPLAEELIEGVLRRGHKMLVTGASKTGKSFLMIELAVALAEGGTWLKFKCRQGNVLYINLEIDEASSLDRVRKVYEKMFPAMDHAGCLTVWNLRGKAQTLDRLTPKLVEKVRGMNFDAILIDPIYKVLTGDENSAADMGKFCNEFDKIATQTGASVIYCHHHSKGGQGNRKAIDRGSGSGVFGRDPDAQLDMTQLVLPDSVKNFVMDSDTTGGFRIETNLREFAPIKPFEVWFKYPIHEIDTTGTLAKLYEEGETSSNLSKSSKAVSKEERHVRLATAYDIVADSDGFASQKDMAEYLECDDQTIKNYVDEFKGEYRRDHGMVFRKKRKDDED